MPPPPIPKSPASPAASPPGPPIIPTRPNSATDRPDPDPPRSPNGRRSLILAGIGIFAMVIAIILIRTWTLGSGQSVSAIKSNPRDDFRILCRATMDSIDSSPAHRPSVGEQRFQAAQLQRDLVNVARGNSPLAPIALRWIQIQTNAVGSLQEGGEAVVDLLKLWLEDGPELPTA